ncbi:MAG: NADH-quinone oxidoreductase subunit C [Saprospiraceae bacterium]|nr:NADH-quinone oxidoreductase subunit C [Saprospiraceae bacterium]
MKDLIERLHIKYSLTDIEHQRENFVYLTIRKENAIDLVTYLKDYEGFSHFVLLSCVDWIEDGKFQLTYFLNQPNKKFDIAIRTMIPRENAEMQSSHHLWKQIVTYQRELREMYGINFPGSPGIEENFILEGWDEIPPMRREFDTKKYSEETFFPREGRKTYDPATYMKDKLYPNAPITAKVNKKDE